MKSTRFETEFGGKTLIAEFTDLADQTNGSVTIRYGNTVVLVTAVMSEGKKSGVDYFPLSVDFEEKFYAAGQILGSRFVRRETKPTEEATLSGRVIDRTIRPLFPDYMRNEVHVVATVLSMGDDDPDILGLVGASLALSVSDIPWNGPVGGVRMGIAQNGEIIVNPTYKERADRALSLEAIVCGKEGTINMIEMGAGEIPEDTAVAVLTQGLKEIEKLCAFQREIIAKIGKEKAEISYDAPEDSLKELFAQEMAPRLSAAIFSDNTDKTLSALKKEWFALCAEKLPDIAESHALFLWEERVDTEVHRAAIDEGKRADGRDAKTIRPLFAQAGGISEILHGTGIFYRGGTHVLSVLTLGGPQDTQIIDGMEEQSEKRFMHHYNFPPFSTGETGRMGVNRRMIGHGALAEKALSYVIPGEDAFPYVIRIVSEVFASNGSSSMASTCASTLALMDAGVPIKAPVAGIAMGLMYRNEKEYVVLTDIQGPEDHYGDMDFKVAGTRTGITAVQMDVKVSGVSLAILTEAFARAKEARLEILSVIENTLSAPRSELAKSAPRILTMTIPTDKIGLVIGSGGKTIKKIMDESSAQVDINDDGRIFVTGKDGSAEKGLSIIESLTHEYKPGERVEGVVEKLLDFGAIVSLSPHADGLVHISEIAPFHIEKISDVLKEGDRVPVVVKDVDKERGRISLSIKDADPDFVKQPK